jgi:WD40 repeat protein
VRAGIPAVVGTSMAIADNLATDLAIRFYAGLANGLNLERAWAEAIDNIIIKKGTSNVRGMYREDEESDSQSATLAERFPWEIYYREGSEAVKDWNLPTAANNPLFGLPPIPASYSLPERPFLYLKRYEREHARLFFGRSYYISSLYKQVTDRKSAPIVLMYGQAGVGKSSLLDAGLLPRLEATHEVVYIRRGQEKGLLGTLEDALGLSQERLNLRQLELISEDYQGEMHGAFQSFIGQLRDRLANAKGAGLSESELEDYLLRRDLRQFWKKLEHELGKPLIVILDQAEEMYTRPMKKPPVARLPQAGGASRASEHAHPEFAPFLATLAHLFGDPADMPQGKLVLSYRKEYHPEIEEGLKMYGLPRGYLFLEQLKARDLVEILDSFTTRPDLLQKYNIGTELGLPEAIATDLTAETTSPVAPLLQIVLSRLWDEHEKNHDRLFRYSDYEALKRYGISVYDFFIQQLEELRAWNSSLVDSGFVLDFLRFHITALNTSATRQVEELRELYRHRQEELEGLIDRSSNLSLLVQVRPGTYMLAHDTLAPEVLREFNESDKEAQRAARILASKLADIESVHSNEDLDEQQAQQEIEQIFVAETDLAVVERGLKWMRQVGTEESALLDRSREKRRQAERKRQRIYVSLGVLGVLVVGSMLLAFRLWRSAERSRVRAQASQLMARASQLEATDPTLALRVAEAAWRLNPNAINEKGLLNLFTNNFFYQKKIELGQGIDLINTKPSPDGKWFATFGYEEGVPRLLDENGNEVVKFKGSAHLAAINSIAFSPDGRRILTGSNDSTAKLWNTNGEHLLTLKYHRDAISLVGFSPNGDALYTSSYDRSVAVWDIEGRLKLFLPGGSDWVNHVAISPDGQMVCTVTVNDSDGSWIRVRGLDGTLLHEFQPHDNSGINNLMFTPDNQQLLLAGSLSVALCQLNGELLGQISADSQYPYSNAVLLADGRTVAVEGHDLSTWWFDPSNPSQPVQTGAYKNQTRQNEQTAQALYPMADGSFISQADQFYAWGANAISATAPTFASQIQWAKAGPHFVTTETEAEGAYRLRFWQHIPNKNLLADSLGLTLPVIASTLTLAHSLQYLALKEPSNDTLLLYDLKGELLRQIDLSPGNRKWSGSGGQVVISPNDSLLAVLAQVDDQYLIRVFHQNGRWLVDLPTGSDYPQFAFSADSRTLVLLEPTGIKKWSFIEGKAVTVSTYTNLFGPLRLSPDGQWALANNSNSAFVISLSNPNAPLIELPGNSSNLIDYAFATNNEVVLLRADRTLTRWNTNGQRLAVYPLGLGLEANFGPLTLSGNGRYAAVLSDNKVLVHDLALPLDQFLASGSIARFDAIDFAEAYVPVPLKDLDTLTNPTDLARVGTFYANYERKYDFDNLTDKKRYEIAEDFYKKSLKVERLAYTVHALADLYLFRNKKFDLEEFLTEDASPDDLRQHVQYVNSLIDNDTLRAREFAPTLKSISLKAIAQQRNPTVVGGLLRANQLLRERVPKAGLDTLFRTNQLAELREYAGLLGLQYHDRDTRKDLMLRAAQLWQRVLKSDQAQPRPDDSVAAAKVNSRLTWYHLSSGEFSDAEVALRRVGQLDKKEPHQYPNEVLLFLLTGRTEAARKAYLARKGKPFEVDNPEGKSFVEVFNQSAQSLRGKGILKPQYEQVTRRW